MIKEKKKDYLESLQGRGRKKKKAKDNKKRENIKKEEGDTHNDITFGAVFLRPR